MRFGIFLILLLASCAEVPVRRVPAAAFRAGDIALNKSSAHIYPESTDSQDLRFSIFLNLKDENGKGVDCNQDEISLRTKGGKALPIEVRRQATGRYFIILKFDQRYAKEVFTLKVKDEILLKNIKLNFQRPSERHSNVSIVHAEKAQLRLRLELRDQNNQLIQTLNPPDVLLDGIGEISELRRIQDGIWEFQVDYIEMNQIFYISVRAQDVYLAKIFRFQYVEK